MSSELLHEELRLRSMANRRRRYQRSQFQETGHSPDDRGSAPDPHGTARVIVRLTTTIKIETVVELVP
jgi:hypothetical protein